MHARSAVLLATVLAALLTSIWLGTGGEAALGGRSEPRPLIPGTYYAADSSGPAIAVDLPAVPEGSYELLLTSLGDSAETYPVHLSSECGAGSETSGLTEIVPLAWKSNPLNSPGVTQIAASSSESTQRPARDIENGPATSRHFFLHATDSDLENPRGYVRVATRLLGEGRSARVYGDVQLREVDLSPGLVSEIIRRLDDEVIPRSRELIGEHVDVDGDGKLAVLVTPWLDRLQGGKTSVKGFVRSSDFRSGGKPPYSNRADLLYLNSTLRADDDLGALLAHEYTHAVCCSRRRGQAGNSLPFRDEEDWLNEAIAHVAEQRHGAGWSNLDERLASFLDAPENCPLVVRDYYRAGRWRDPGCRGATFLFLNWLCSRHGDGLLGELVTDPRTGTQKLTALTGHSFAELLRHWAIALHQGEAGDVSLLGRVGRCELTGLRRRFWNDLDQPHTFGLQGTAVVCVRLEATCARRVVITPAAGACLQVTVVRPGERFSAARLAGATPPRSVAGGSPR